MKKSTKAATKIEPVIKLEKASIIHQNKVILSDVNFEVFKSEFVYLIGRVGSGKSSLIKTLYGELPLPSGSGLISGFDLNLTDDSIIPYLRRDLGIIFQDFQLLTDRSVYKNLEFVLRATNWTDKQAIDTRIKEVLEIVSLASKINKMPHELSVGEQQRVVIARALLNDPEIILADEPTANLDPATSEDIMQILWHYTLNEGTILMATHNYSLIKKFKSRMLRCHEGKVHEIKDIEGEIKKWGDNLLI